MPTELWEFLKSHTDLLEEDVYVDDGADIPTTFLGKFRGFGEQGEALIQSGDHLSPVTVGGLWSVKTEMGDYKRSMSPWRCKKGIPPLEPICPREENSLPHTLYRIDYIQESGRPYQKWVKEREEYQLAQETAHMPTPQPPLSLWHVHTPLDITKEIEAKSNEHRIVRMIEDKVKTDAHFKTLSFLHTHVTHADGRGFSWESDDQGFYLSFSMGYPEDLSPALRQSHLKVYVYGRLMNKRGYEVKEEEFAKGDAKAEECLIPVTEWLRWPLWLAPKLPIDLQSMKERWEEEQKLKLETHPQEKISVESFPEHSMPPMPLFTPLPSEEKTGHVETFPQAESSLPSIFFTPVHPQEGQEQEGFESYKGPNSSILEKHHIGSHQPIKAPQKLIAFPNAVEVKKKTLVQGGGSLRERWKDDKYIYEWDRQHGTVEKYNKRGKHKGEFNPNTGEQLKPADPTRYIEP